MQTDISQVTIRGSRDKTTIFFHGIASDECNSNRIHYLESNGVLWENHVDIKRGAVALYN